MLHLSSAPATTSTETERAAQAERRAESPTLVDRRCVGRGLLETAGRFRSLARLAMFVMVGGSGMVVDLTVLAQLRWSGMPLESARALAILVAMTWNFWLNRRLTFADADPKPWLIQYGQFCLSCSLGAVINWQLTLTLCSYWPTTALWELLAAATGVAAGVAFNFSLSCLVVFRGRGESR